MVFVMPITVWSRLESSFSATIFVNLTCNFLETLIEIFEQNHEKIVQIVMLKSGRNFYNDSQRPLIMQPVIP